MAAGCECWTPECVPSAKPNSKLPFPKPNPINLSTAYSEVQVPFASIVKVLADPGANILAYPYHESQDADVGVCVTSRGSGAERFVFLNAPGTWKVKLAAGGTAVRAVVIDCWQGIGALIAGGIQIAGGGPITLAPSSTVPLVFSAPAVVSVGGASGLALAANTNRKYLFLRNMDATKIISLGFDNQTAVNGSGVVLNPGEIIAMQSPGDALTVGIVNAISNPATANLAIQEAV